jgi:hypothetical protein
MAQHKVFISHAHRDKTFVNRLVSKLHQAGGPDHWYDTLEVGPATPSIVEAVEAGIREADYFAIVLSPASVSSQWVSYEIDAARRFESLSSRCSTMLLKAPRLSSTTRM